MHRPVSNDVNLYSILNHGIHNMEYLKLVLSEQHGKPVVPLREALKRMHRNDEHISKVSVNSTIWGISKARRHEY